MKGKCSKCGNAPNSEAHRIACNKPKLMKEPLTPATPEQATVPAQ